VATAPKTPAGASRAWIALGAAVVVTALLRLALVASGPDTESDAYAHHVLARRVLLEPGDPRVHWVWLPLFHWLSAAVIRLGGAMDALRVANALALALPPLLVARQVERARAPSDGCGAPPWPLTPWLAGALVALHPWVTTIGATAQNEPLFLVLLASLSFALAGGAQGIAATLLAALVLLRYEGWAVLLGLGAAFVLPGRELLFGPRPLRGAILTLGPAALAIVAWSAIRVGAGEAPLAYLRDTHQFVQEARHDHLTFAEALGKLPYYPAYLPFKSFGFPVLFALLGLVPMARAMGPAFVAPYGACLAFVSATWMSGGQLGLLRHFVSSVPLFAAAIAFGVAEIARRAPAPRATAVAATASLVALALETLHLRGSFLHERAVVAAAWPDRRAVVDAVRALPSGARVVCDEPTIEILAGLPLEGTKRWWATDPSFEAWVRGYAAEGAPVYLAIVRERLRDPHAFGEPLVASPDARYALFRVDPPGAASR
jgi:hypothetical protein